MRFLFLGDIVGQPGLNLVRKAVPMLRQRERLDLVVANAENTTNGSGLAPRDYKLLRAAGVDAITMGDHIYKKYELADTLRDEHEPICKPANYPVDAPGREHVLLEVNGLRVLVVSLLGRTFTRPVDCPFAAVDRVLKQVPADITIIDMHAEATADKYLMFHHTMGRVTAVLGTHTHIPTADEQVRNGTAFQCDVGMCGPYDSILGRRVDRVLQTAIQFVPTSFDVAVNDVRLSGVIVDVDDQTGKAFGIERLTHRDG
jgi:2',3'-cyclic-nucleotide 2'-phosphodiesterase